VASWVEQNVAGTTIHQALQASSLGWFVSAPLWRVWAMRDIRGELVTALQLAAGVSARKE
jgi:hypothetical protein